MAWPPHITVATIVKDADRYLMVEEWIAGELVLNQPAGHLEPNETCTLRPYAKPSRRPPGRCNLPA